MIEIAVQGSESFEQVKAAIEAKLQRELLDKLMQPVELLVLLKAEHQPEKITNSMLKRKLQDYR